MIVAMDKEYKQLRPLFPEDKLILQKSGIATVNAAIQTVEMIRQYKPDCIISSGCAGGNGDDINLQDVVASSELTYHDVYGRGKARSYRHRRLVRRLERKDARDHRPLPRSKGCRYGECRYRAGVSYI